jgi:AcrR family transcriptional regulator
LTPVQDWAKLCLGFQTEVITLTVDSSVANEQGKRGRYAKGTRTREALIDAALDHFSRSGYRGAPLASIAESVGVTRSGVLHHFASKDDLLAAALDRRDRLAIDTLAQLDATDSSVSVFSRLLSDAHVHNRGLVQFFTALVGEAVAEGHPAHDHVRDRYVATRQLWRDLLEQARQRGEIPDDVDIDKAAPLLIAVMDGLQIQWLYDESVDISGLLEDFVHALPRKSSGTAARPRRAMRASETSA